MEAICRRSGASTGSLYHHFKSKEQLAAAVYVEGILDHQSGFLDELEAHGDARVGIQAVVRFHLAWIEDHPDWARYLFQMRNADFMATAEETIQQENKEFVKRMFQWFKPHVENETLRRLPLDMYLSIIVGPCHEFARRWLAGMTRTDLDAAAEIIGDAVWRSLEKS